VLCFVAGWKGWTSQQAFDEDLNYIEAARIGHTEMLQAIFGPPEKTPPGAESVAPQSSLPPLTPNAFDQVFGRGTVTHA
jgi:hypothetical protein